MLKAIWVDEETHAFFTSYQAKLAIERGGIKTSQAAAMRKLLDIKPKLTCPNTTKTTTDSSTN